MKAHLVLVDVAHARRFVGVCLLLITKDELVGMMASTRIEEDEEIVGLHQVLLVDVGPEIGLLLLGLIGASLVVVYTDLAQSCKFRAVSG